ncbi:MAG: UvrD-helicase domain-containing protein [Treponema sp.]|nr:UvrD-helicase domain-containing protein [Treponema sp.]
MKNVKYISASAGSGKTYSLTKALTEAIQEGKVEPENVILTTFTKAAASEFKEKAKAMLYENGLVTEADRLDQALIGTIHSVAENLIMKYWYVLGLSPKISPIAEEDLEFFKTQSMTSLLSHKELSFLNDFAEEFNIRQERSSKINYDFWKKDLSQILEYATNYDIKEFESSIAFSKKLTSSLVHGGYHIKINKDAINEYLDKAEIINKVSNSDKQDEIQIAINNLRRDIQKSDPSSFKLAKYIKKFFKDHPFKDLKEQQVSISDELANLYSSEEVRNWLNHYIDTLFYLAEEWEKQYEEYKRKNHLIDFSDMEKYFHELLGNSEVANEIKATYKYIFVDEFQDCSPKQVKIFDSLSEIVENSIWVGDKKQAIYGFRGSDTELTTAVMDIIAYNKNNNLDGCTTDILDKSWRSLPAIVNFTNKVYSKAFNKITSEEQKELSLKSQRQGEGKVGFWWFNEGKKEDRAKSLAANIVDMINKKEKPSDIAVLARKNSDLEDVAAALREYDVPVYIDEGGQAESETVSLVISLLQLVDDEKAELPKAQIAFLTEPDYKLGKIMDDKIEFRMTAKEGEHFYNDIPLVQKMLAVLKSGAFRDRLLSMGGYTLDRPGEIIPYL